MTKADMLSTVLDELLSTSPEIEAAAVVSADGLPMASALPEHVEEDRLAAMSAALLVLGEKAAGGLGKGGLSQVFVEGEHGFVVLMGAGQSVLVVVTSKESKVGLVLFEMRRTAARVAEVLATEPQPVTEPPSQEPVVHEEVPSPWATSRTEAPSAPPAPAPAEHGENVISW